MYLWKMFPLEADNVDVMQGVKGVGGGVVREVPPSFLRTTVAFDERCWIAAGLQSGLLSKPTTCLLNLFTRPLRRVQASRPSSSTSCCSSSLPLLLLPPALFQSRKARLLLLPTPHHYLDYITHHRARQGFRLVGFSLMPDVWSAIWEPGTVCTCV